MADTSSCIVRKRRPLVRTRTGCLCCRRRRKKCDERKPKCGACARLKYDCNYDLVLNWQDCNQLLVDIRGQRPGTFLTQFLVSGYADMELYNAIVNCKQVNLKRLFPKSTNRKLKLDEGTSDMSRPKDSVEEHLFEYYVEVICRKKVFADSHFNEFRAVTVPQHGMASSLFQSIMAIAASDMERNVPSKSDYYRLLSLKYKNNAIDLLYKSLDNPNPECMTGLVISIIILCSLEIGDNAMGRWVSHLQEACLVMQSISDEQILSSSVLLFGYRYFALRYSLLLTTMNREHCLRFTAETPLRMIGLFFESNIIDHLFGCSPKLIFLINRIVQLKCSEIQDREKLDEIIQIDHELTEIKQVDLGDDERLKICAQLYLNITRVYFRNVFWTDLQRIESRSIDLDSLNKTIARSFSLFRKLADADTENSTMFPTWALFILGTNGLYQNDDSLRVNVLDVFDKLERLWPKASPAVIRTAIELIWKSHDLRLDDEYGATKNSLSGAQSGVFCWQDVLCSSGIRLALT